MTGQKVKHDGKSYYIGSYITKGKVKLYVIDYDELENIKNIKLGATNKYVGTRREGYIHTNIMGPPPYRKDGLMTTVDHINRNTHDNRRANLRFATQTEQNENQKRRKRKNIPLPKNCGVTKEDIPKCTWYRPADPKSGHSDYFVLKLKGDVEKKCVHLVKIKEFQHKRKA